MLTTLKATRGKRNKAGIIFGLAFLLPAIGFLFFGVLPNIYDWVRMQKWEPVEAQLLSSKLNSRYSDGSLIYEAIGQYRYDYLGASFRGKKIGISSGSDNIGSWHQETYQAMRRRPFQVWVNPDNPREAVFDRNIRWELLGFKMIFVLVFGMVGGGLIWLMCRQTPDPPSGVPLWQWDPRWRENRIRSNAKMALGAIWFFAIIWNAISAPVGFAVPEELAKGNNLILIALLFPIVGMGMLGYAVRQTLAWRRFGITTLSLDPFPGSIGGDVGGSVDINLPPQGDHKFNAEITCSHVYQTRSGSKSRTERRVLWQDEQILRLEPGINGSRVRFKFEVPGGLPSSEACSSNYHEWTLRLSGEMPGVDLDRSFDIPVFAKGGPAKSSIALERLEHPQPTISERIVRVHQLGTALELYYPMFRSLSTALLLLFMGGGFGGIGGYFMFAEVRNGPPVVMMALFALVGLPMFLGGLYKLGNSLRINVSGSGVRIMRRVWGIPFETLVPRTEVKRIRKKLGWQATQGTRTKAFYQLELMTKDGKKHNMGDTLPSASAAERLVERLHKALSLSEKIEVESVEAGRGLKAESPTAEVGEERLAQRKKNNLLVAVAVNLIGVTVFVLILYEMGFLDVLINMLVG